MTEEYAFKKLIGPYGIPIYHHPVPSVIKAVSMEWVVFTGSADDESVGAPGLYHWFEHVPFRGTKKYTSTQDMHKRIMRVGGHLNAHTGTLSTSYESVVPVSEWRYGLSVITDLLAQPLLQEEDIIKEREIIFQEIARSRSSVSGEVGHIMPRILAPNHPYGHHVLGSEESLKSITPDVLAKAHSSGYDRSRVALVVCGGITEHELLEEVNSLAHTIPDNGLAPRSRGAYYGPLPAWDSSPVEIETGFPESIIRLMFPITEEQTARESIIRELSRDMFSFGSLSSPFMRILREDRNLIYTGGMICYDRPGGSTIGFTAQTKKENIDAVVQGFKDVLSDSETISPERFSLVKEGNLGNMDLEPFDASNKVDQASNDIVGAVGIVSEAERRFLLHEITFEEVLASMKTFDLNQGKYIVFKGMGT